MIYRAALMRAVLIVIFLSVSFSSLIAKDAVWTLAAVPFSINSSYDEVNSEVSKTVTALKEDIPRLVLSKMSASLERTILNDELYERNLYDLQTKMDKLLADYAGTVKARDQQIFTFQSPGSLKKNIEEQEKKIEAAAQKIEENFNAQAELSLSAAKKNSNTSTQTIREKVVLYKNNPSELYSIDTKKITTDEELIQKINKDSIRGLITGSIKVFGEYLQITSSLSIFPKKNDSEPYQITVHMSDSVFAAEEISVYMMEVISNSLPSQVSFNLLPGIEAENASVFVSDVYLKGSSTSTELLKGIYSIRVECPGYETVSFSYNFNQNTDYTFTIQLKKQVLYPVVFSNPFSTPGTMFLNAVSYGSFPASITVNGQPYLGEFLSEEGWSNYFTYNSSYAEEYKSTSLSYVNKNVNSLIEKSRKRLYISYAAVVAALPVYFYTNAVYKNLESAQLLAIPVNENLSNWKTASTISLSSVIVLGVNMGVQLALYLADADKILPKEQDPSKDKGN